MGGRTTAMARLVGALALVAVASCGGGNGGGGSGGSGGGGSGGPIPFSQFEAAAEQAVCHLLVLCGEFPDEATCLASDQVKPHYYETLGQDITDGKVSYDGAKARSCIDMINGLASCDRTSVLEASLDTTCTTGIVTGTVAPGGSCFVNEECAGGSTCQKTDASCDSFSQCCVGTCVSPLAVAAGGDCSVAGAACVSGTMCIVNGTTHAETCVTTGAAGASCGASMPCTYPFHCDATSGTCKAPAATGGACDPSVGSVTCDSPKDYCSTTTMVCTTLLAVGSPCTQGTPSTCVSYAACDAATNTCLERPAVGAPCVATGPSCLGGSCDATTATCTLMPTGGACS
jgi:hypothetical protein